MFDGPKLTREIKELLFQGDFAKASAIIHQDLSTFPSGEHNRIDQLRKLHDSVRQVAETEPQTGHSRILLTRDQREPVPIAGLPADILTLPPGVYATGMQYSMASSFVTDFPGIGAQEAERLRTSRFHVSLDAGTRSTFRIVRDAFICGANHMMDAYAYEGGRYAHEESGRTAKSCGLNTYVPATRTEPAALLLPIPHHAGNYYHVMGEMIYGLRLAAHVRPDSPIVYQEDRFRLLPQACRLLGLDETRLIPFREARAIRFQKALIPGQPPFFWSEAVFRFFRGLLPGDPRPILKLYVSRRFSGRGPQNEQQIEDHLHRRGFLIIHPEHLDFEQQTDLFSRAAAVVSTHGAGLTNIAFMRPGTALVEMFPPHMLTRDFYMRSRHNRMPYGGLMFDGVLPVERLDAMLKRHRL